MQQATCPAFQHRPKTLFRAHPSSTRTAAKMTQDGKGFCEGAPLYDRLVIDQLTGAPAALTLLTETGLAKRGSCVHWPNGDESSSAADAIVFESAREAALPSRAAVNCTRCDHACPVFATFAAAIVAQ